MKTKSMVTLLACVITLAAGAFGQSKDISGRWVAPFNREGTPVTIAMNLKVSGNQVTGTITHARGIVMNIENGKLEGEKISFETNVENNGRKFNFHYEGEVGEDSIKLHSVVNGQPGNQVLNFHRSEQ
jgi:hypothetical protein